jgi:hypothetical protein
MHADVQKVIDKIDRYAEEIEFTPSKEVLRLYKYNIIHTKMGGQWDQTFTPMVFGEGDARQLTAYQLYSQARLYNNPIFTVEHLKAIFLDTTPVSAEFLSTLGFEDLWMLCKEVIGICDKVTDKDDWKKVVDAFGLYVTFLHNWIHFYMPWYCGEFFPQAKEEEIKEFAKLYDWKR